MILSFKNQATEDIFDSAECKKISCYLLNPCQTFLTSGKTLFKQASFHLINLFEEMCGKNRL